METGHTVICEVQVLLKMKQKHSNNIKHRPGGKGIFKTCSQKLPNSSIFHYQSLTQQVKRRRTANIHGLKHLSQHKEPRLVFSVVSPQLKKKNTVLLQISALGRLLLYWIVWKVPQPFTKRMLWSPGEREAVRVWCRGGVTRQKTTTDCQQMLELQCLFVMVGWTQWHTQKFFIGPARWDHWKYWGGN